MRSKISLAVMVAIALIIAPMKLAAAAGATTDQARVRSAEHCVLAVDDCGSNAAASRDETVGCIF